MILVTGGTGFVGRTLIPHLAGAGHLVRCLVRPSPYGLRLPRGMPVLVSVGSLTDSRAISDALRGVDTVIHLASAERGGFGTGLMEVDHGGSQRLLAAAVEADVRRIVYLSHLGADRASALSTHKIKGIVEEFIRRSGIPHTIVRSALLYGSADYFTNVMAALMRIMPGLCPLPGSGQAVIQPLWVEDLANCILLSLDDDRLLNQTISLGGPEFLSVSDMLHLVMRQIGVRRILVNLPLPYLRWIIQTLRPILSGSPLTSNWLDHVAVNRTCEVNSVARYFDIKTAVFEHTIGYLSPRNWRDDFGLVLGRSNP